MQNKKLTASDIEKIAREIFEPELQRFAQTIVELIQQDLEEKMTAQITNLLLDRRTELAETDAVMADRGMTLEEIRLHNARAGGYNERTTQLRRKILGVTENASEDVLLPNKGISETTPTTKTNQKSPEAVTETHVDSRI